MDGVRSIISYQMDEYGTVKVKLAEVLDSCGITRNRLKTLTGVKYEVIDRYYRNHVERVDLDFIAKVCYVLNCNVNDLLEYESPELKSVYSKFCLLSRQRGETMARIIDGNDKNMVGGQVRRLRIERGMSQQMLSTKLETLAIYICRGSISRIEDKQRTVTDIELYGLAEILGVSIESLFEH